VTERAERLVRLEEVLDDSSYVRIDPDELRGTTARNHRRGEFGRVDVGDPLIGTPEYKVSAVRVEVPRAAGAAGD